MAQAARPSLTVAQLHTPLTNIPTLAHALTSGDGRDKVDIHQLLSGFADRSDGKTWDFTVSRKRARPKEEPSNDDNGDGDGDDDDGASGEKDESSDDHDHDDVGARCGYASKSAPTTPAPRTPTPTPTRQAKRKRAARATSPLLGERQEKRAREAPAVVVAATRSRRGGNKTSIADEGFTSRGQRRGAQTRTSRTDRTRKQLKFGDAAADGQDDDKRTELHAEDDEQKIGALPAAKRLKTVAMNNNSHHNNEGDQRANSMPQCPSGAVGRDQADCHPVVAETIAPLSVVGQDGVYDPARLFHISAQTTTTPPPPAAVRRHSLIFPLLHSPFLEQHQQQQALNFGDEDVPIYYSDYRVGCAPHFTAPLHTPPLFVRPPTPPPPPAPGPWYSMLIDDSTIPLPPPPPPPLSGLNSYQRASSPQPPFVPGRCHFPPSPSMPLSSPDVNPRRLSLGPNGDRTPSPYTVGGGGLPDYPWGWLSDACEDEILWFLRTTPSAQQVDLLHQQAPYSQRNTDERLGIPRWGPAPTSSWPSGEPDGLYHLEMPADDRDSGHPMTSLIRPTLARLREAAGLSASPVASWMLHNGRGFANSYSHPAGVEAATQQRIPLSVGPSGHMMSSLMSSPLHYHRQGHSSMPSSASSSHPSSPFTVTDMEIPSFSSSSSLPTFDLPAASASPLLLPIASTTTTSTSTTPSSTPTRSSLLATPSRHSHTTTASRRPPKRKTAPHRRSEKKST